MVGYMQHMQTRIYKFIKNKNAFIKDTKIILILLYTICSRVCLCMCAHVCVYVCVCARRVCVFTYWMNIILLICLGVTIKLAYL